MKEFKEKENVNSNGIKEKEFEKKGFNSKKNSKHNGKKFKGKRDYRSGKQFNPVDIYWSNDQIAQDFANLSFPYIIGNPIPGNITPGNYLVQGIMSFIVDWVAGANLQDEDASVRESDLDQIATILYTEMRRANAGSTNAIESVDVIISNLIASIDIFCNSVYAHRMIKIANSFSWKNRYIPRELFKLMAFDYDDFIANQSNYRGRFNTLMAEAKTIRTLSKYPFVTAAFSEYEKLFKDSDTDTGREQLILPVKAFHHIYDPVGTTTHPGGMVRLMHNQDVDPSATGNTYVIFTALNTANPTYYKFGYLLDIIERQIQALITDADFNTIQGDIEKAFGEQSGYIEVSGVTDLEATLSPEYSAEFAEFFHNGTFLQLPAITKLSDSIGTQVIGNQNCYVNTIFQYHDPTGRVRVGNRVQVGYATVSPDPFAHQIMASGMYRNGLIDSDDEHPDYKKVIIMTRYKSCFFTDANRYNEWTVPSGNTGYFISGCSNFICFGHYYVSFIDRGVGKTPVEHISAWDNVHESSGTAFAPLCMNEIHPLGWSYETITIPGQGSTKCYYPVGDINNIRLLLPNELDNINVGVFLSLWNIPDRTKI